jgi:hypothetical protein
MTFSVPNDAFVGVELLGTIESPGQPPRSSTVPDETPEMPLRQSQLSMPFHEALDSQLDDGFATTTPHESLPGVTAAPGNPDGQVLVDPPSLNDQILESANRAREKRNGGNMPTLENEGTQIRHNLSPDLVDVEEQMQVRAELSFDSIDEDELEVPDIRDHHRTPPREEPEEEL